MDSKYASSINRQITPLFRNSEILIYPRTVNIICSHEKVEILKLLYIINIITFYLVNILNNTSRLSKMK